MNKPHYTSAANRDLKELLDYIAKDNPQAALNSVEKIEAKCLFIAANPGVGERQPHLGEHLRASSVGHYVIYYRVHADRVEILRIIAGGRDVGEI